MNYLVSLPIFLAVGTLGGLIGAKLKIPAGALIGSLLAVICFKLISKVDWDVPKAFTFALQVFLGIMVGASFHPGMLKVMGKVFFPVITCFHFFRMVFIILTMPVIYKYFLR